MPQTLKKHRDFEDLLSEVGDYGSYQRWLIYVILIPSSFFVAISINCLVFQTVIPNYWCNVPGHERAGLDTHTWRNLTLPRSQGKLSKCEHYEVTWAEDGTQEQPLYHISNTTTKACRSWEHDRSQFTETVATSYGWLCDKESYSTHVLSVSLAGNAVGTAVLQPIADKFAGRRMMFFVSIVIQIVFTIPTLFASNYLLHLALRFLASLAFQCNYQMPLLIVLELMPSDKRTLASGVSFVAWTAGLCTDSFLGWALSDWRYLALASNLPMAIFFVFWRVIPESPRWLLSQGRIKEAAGILIKIGISNGKKSIPPQGEVETELLLLYNHEQKEKNIGFQKIFNYHRIRTRTIALMILSCGMFLVYGCLVLSNNIIENNMFLNHFILSIFELPSNVIGYFSCTYLGRRFTMFKTFFFSALLSFIAALVEDRWTLLVLVAFLKLFMTEALYVLVVIASEIFPTPMRSTGIAMSIVFGFSMMIASPFVMFADFGSSFPYWVWFVSTVVGSMVSLLLPETLGLPLPQTIAEAEDLAADRPFMALVHHWNQHKYISTVGAQDDPETHNGTGTRQINPEHQHLDAL